MDGCGERQKIACFHGRNDLVRDDVLQRCTLLFGGGIQTLELLLLVGSENGFGLVLAASQQDCPIGGQLETLDDWVQLVGSIWLTRLENQSALQVAMHADS